MRRGVALLVLAAIAAPSLAYAQPSPKAAPGAAPPAGDTEAAGKAEFEEGRFKFKIHDFTGASKNFARALQATGSPNAAYFLARCLTELGQLLPAYAMMLRAFRESDAKSATEPKYAATRDAAKDDLAALELRIARVTITVEGAPEGTSVLLNDAPLAAPDLGAPIALLPGSATIVARASGHADVVRKVDILPGENKSIVFSFATVIAAPPPPPPPPRPPPPPPPPPPSMSAMRVAGFVLAGVGVAGFAVFAGTDAAAASDYNTLQKACHGPCTDPKYDSVIRNGRTLEKVSNATLAVGIVGAVGGGALIFFGGGKKKPAKSAAAVALTPEGGSLRYRLSF